MANEKTNKYIVIKRGVCLKGIIETDLDSIVELTDKKAAGMVGKVRLLKDYEYDNKGSADLKKEVAKLNKANQAGSDQVEELVEANAELTALNDDLNKANAELTKQVEEMTAALAAPAKTAKK